MCVKLEEIIRSNNKEIADIIFSDKNISNIPNVHIGYHHDEKTATGCTVIYFPKSAVASADVRGGGAGTMGLDLIQPTGHTEKIQGICISGGSSMGFDAASGVKKYLREKNIGNDTPFGTVPNIPAAILFDLGVGDSKSYPTNKFGFEAIKNAKQGAQNLNGNVGAGIGCTAGKMLGFDYAMKTGQASVLYKHPEGFFIGAYVVVNPLGNTVDLKGNIISGAYDREKKSYINLMGKFLEKTKVKLSSPNVNTTIGVLATDLKLTKTQLKKIAQMGHCGLARVIEPVNTVYDGDTIFATSTNTKDHKIDLSVLGAISSRVLSACIIRAAISAKSEYGYLSCNDILAMD